MRFREDQKEWHCVIVELEKEHDREELWYFERHSGMAEKYLRLVQDIFTAM